MREVYECIRETPDHKAGQHVWADQIDPAHRSSYIHAMMGYRPVAPNKMMAEKLWNTPPTHSKT